MQNRPSARFFKLRLAAMLAWLLTVAWLSLVPNPPQPPYFLAWDKLQHACAYALLCGLIGWVLSSRLNKPRSAWIMAAATAIAFGALLEVLQGLLTTTRQADCFDLLADGLGALLVAALGIALSLRKLEP